jgi:CheY-like chemotaxis protein
LADRAFMMDPHSNRSLRIWIAEDEDDLREALGKSLSREGREILLFADGKELLQHLKRDPAFDIIIADLLMPEVDGLQVLQKSKECNPEGIVIIMTGYASLDTAIRAIRGGAYDYIRKPFKLDEIEVIVKNAGEKIVLVRENRRLIEKLKDTMEEMREIRKPPAHAPDGPSPADLDHKLSEMDVLLKQMIPSDYDFKDREHREKTYQEMKKLIEFKKEGLLTEAEFFSMKNQLLKSLRP